ncbi:hypothetical protein [Thermoflavimicrobium dichotomicum]|uniref:Cupredoxin-like domain-containing protein n=1 Tax=Thermoflavimicrobium dichotomicum TaxID=46223 RepID=A0A1I3U7E9_9BACL|nr:hypothetical protein [Thermoflavimicrobium dichotomicum]SFJ78509.1 hypothetical protein SAMN05421852_12221 [Thermoflavimicrobium dichotomicum]
MKKWVISLVTMLSLFAFSTSTYADSHHLEMKPGVLELTTGIIAVNQGETLHLIVDYVKGPDFTWKIKGDTGFVVTGKNADANVYLGVPPGNYHLQFSCQSGKCTASGEMSK